MTPPMVTINPHISKVNIRTRLAVYWPINNEYYQCKVTSLRYNDDEMKYTVTILLYDDGVVETVDLTKKNILK